mmetsp:Transcript_7932/g.11399  ORF Transcript_7932/g.11399 Transcript_7932/m.11399 type:complete len:195 (-) Transcript_7932:1974-2558(-)
MRVENCYALLLVVGTCLSIVQAKIELPFMAKKPKYTPLIFFRVPKGMMPEVDECEEALKNVEEELGVEVDRMDIMRDEVACELFNALSPQQHMPLLYNRESRQTVYVPHASKEEDGAFSKYLSSDRLRAWAKGRLMPAIGEMKAKAVSESPMIVSGDDNAIDQEDLLDQQQLTPLQREGKRAIKERTKENSETK